MAVITIRTPYYSDIASLIDYVGDYYDFYYQGTSDLKLGADTNNNTVPGETINLHGPGYNYGFPGGPPTGGTVTSIELTVNGTLVADVAGLYVPLISMYNAALDSGEAMFALFGDTTFIGGRGIDRIALGGGDDDIRLFEGDDVASGGGGEDILDGGTGTDALDGGTGDDTFIVDNAADKVIEAAGVAGGSDTVKASATYALGAGVAVEKLETTLATGTGALNLFGNELAQTITGNDGANNLVGNGGNDVISARAGADGLQGGLGNDTMAGNGGNDGFYFSTALNAATNVDRILDFGQATGNADLIRLDNAVFATLGAAGFLKADFFAANAEGMAKDGNDHIVYETDTGKLFYDSNGNTAGGATQFATLTNFASLTGANALSAADFYVF